jgi:predicted DNA binding CopG/RHH family protein
MSIIKAPVKAPAKVLENFIQSAPDGAKPGKAGASEDDGVQITLRLSKEQLARLSNVAKRQGIPRASYIKRAVFVQLEADENRQ